METRIIPQIQRNFRQYIRFAMVGVLVATLAILLREIVVVLLPPGEYRFSYSIAIVWTLGILLSFYLNRVYTFSAECTRWTVLVKYSVIAIIAGILCVVISNMAYAGLAQVLPAFVYLETVSFIIGNLVASVVSFAAHRLYVFR